MNVTGSDKTKSRQLAEKLNNLLETYSIFYQNARSFRWDINGEKFIELHEKFEEQYNDLLLEINEVAEHIRTTGFVAEHNYSSYAQLLAFRESTTVSDSIKSAEHILETLKTMILEQREIPELLVETRMKNISTD